MGENEGGRRIEKKEKRQRREQKKEMVGIIEDIVQTSATIFPQDRSN